MSFSVFQVAAILKSNMAAIRNIFQLGSHPKKIQRIFFIQGAKFHALFTKSTIFSPICPTNMATRYQDIYSSSFFLVGNEYYRLERERISQPRHSIFYFF